MNNSFLKYLLADNPETTLNEQGIKMRKYLNKVIIPLAKTTTMGNLIIERKAEMPKDQPIIYAATHVYKDDILNSFITINNNAYLLFANKTAILETANGILLWLNGVVYVDRQNKKSREASKAKMKYVLNHGGNLLMYPEGMWNIEDNILIEQLNMGIYDVAKETNAVVAPLILHVVDKKCYAILESVYDMTKLDKKEALIDLRDRLATAKFELVEKYSNYANQSRADLEKEKTLKEQWDEWVENEKKRTKVFFEAEERAGLFRDPNIISEEEVFTFLDNMEMTHSNAFLLGSGKKYVKRRKNKNV